jgi:hypothetical protein
MRQNPKKQRSAVSETDALVEVAMTVKSARCIAEACSDPTLLYLLDMAILHACESLDAVAGEEGAEGSPGFDLAGVSS